MNLGNPQAGEGQVTAFSQESRPDNTELATVFKRNRTADCVHLLTTDYGSGMLTTDYRSGLNGLNGLWRAACRSG